MGEYSTALLENRCQTLEQIVQSLQANIKRYVDKYGLLEEEAKNKLTERKKTNGKRTKKTNKTSK